MQAVGPGDMVTRGLSQRVMSLAPGRGSDITEVRRKAPGENGMQMVTLMHCTCGYIYHIKVHALMVQ